jgi:hypothetical protein
VSLSHNEIHLSANYYVGLLDAAWAHGMHSSHCFDKYTEQSTASHARSSGNQTGGGMINKTAQTDNPVSLKPTNTNCSPSRGFWGFDICA